MSLDYANMRGMIFILLFLQSTGGFANHRPSIDPDQLISKVSQKLAAFKFITYNYQRSTHYYSEDYHSDVFDTVYIEFADESPGVSRFQVATPQSKIIYNGKENFFIDRKSQSIRIEQKRFEEFGYLSAFLNSLLTLRGALPLVSSDTSVKKSLSDTLISNKQYYSLSLTLVNKTLDGLGRFIPTTVSRSFVYKLIIDKQTLLPFQMIQTNDAEPKDYMVSTFTDIRNERQKHLTASWNYSYYAREYQAMEERKLSVIDLGETAPGWTLKLYSGNERLSLADLKGQVVLLDFWMRECVPCIVAIPKLNRLRENYKGEDFCILGVNGTDARETITAVYRKHKPDYETLIDEGGKITSLYGVDKFPSAVLIDKKGKVVYAGTNDFEAIERILRTSLK